MKKVEYLIKHNRFVQFVYKTTFSFLFRIMTTFTPVKKNLILVNSFSGKKYNDSPKILCEEIVRQFGPDKYEIVWAFNNPASIEDCPFKKVKIDSLKYFRTAFKAKYWITNVNIERGLHFKKKKQIYLNTWHGTGPKTVGNAANGRNDYNCKNVNFMCSDGEYLKQVLVNNLKAKPENVLMCGRPREDILYHPSEELKVKMMEKYGITKDDYVILYAPTWREPKNMSSISEFNLDLDIKLILDTIPNSKILFRSHSITEAVEKHIKYSNRFMRTDGEQDIANLFLVSDVVISDYSSCVFDFVILNRPFICFVPDYEEYIKTRSLYFDMEQEYPFGVQKNSDEVLNVLKEIVKGNNKLDKFKELKEKYNPYGGNATKECIKALFEK